MELMLGLEIVSDLVGKFFALETERFSGLEGGTVNEQHHDRRRNVPSRRDPDLRRPESTILGYSNPRPGH